MVGCIVVPKDTQVLILGILGGLPYMKKGLCRSDKVKELERGRLSEWALYAITSVLIRSRQRDF